jgi:FixJ family two-component response regulator/GNAT superfamily N-acetyltransferase
VQQNNTVYVVGFEKGLSDAFQALLHFYDIGVDAYPDGESFLHAAQSMNLDDCCLLLQADLPDGSGLSLLRRLCGDSCNSRVIVVVDKVDQELRHQAIDAGATEVIGIQVASAYLFAQLSNLMSGPVELPSTPDTKKTLRNGAQVTFRMLRPDDADMEQEFVTSLSDRSRYLRFFSGLKELTPFMLEQMTNPVFPISYALIATTFEEEREQQIAVGRYAPTGAEGIAEFAVVVADEWQGFGIASELMHFVITAAAVAGIRCLEGLVLRENAAMLSLADKLGFKQTNSEEGGPSVVRVFKHLGGQEIT